MKSIAWYGGVVHIITTGITISLGKARNIYCLQLSWRLIHRPILDSDSEDFKSVEYRREAKCTIFLSYTSNIISSGLRETIKFLAKHSLVHMEQSLHVAWCV